MALFSRVKIWNAGEVLFASDLNAEFNNLLNNTKPQSIEGYSANVAQMQLVTDPGDVGSESLATSLSGELERIRFVLKRIANGTQWYAANVGGLTPPGAILSYGGTTAPSGYLLCDGSQVSRTTYANLFSAVGTAFGSGDGSTTFHVPDLRGRFLRGWNNGSGRDPGVSGRPAMNSGGGVNDNIGSVQDDATALNGISLNDPGHNHGVQGFINFGTAGGPDNTGTFANSTTSTNTTGITISSTDPETRPLNAYVNYIIKF